MHLDGALLADPVEPADPLLQQIHVLRQVVKHEMPGKLEIPPLAADLRAHQYPRAIRLGEERRIPVPLQQREVFVEEHALHPRGLVQLVQQLLRQLAGLGDDQDFLLTQSC